MAISTKRFFYGLICLRPQPSRKYAFEVDAEMVISSTAAVSVAPQNNAAHVQDIFLFLYFSLAFFLFIKHNDF